MNFKTKRWNQPDANSHKTSSPNLRKLVWYTQIVWNVPAHKMLQTFLMFIWIMVWKMPIPGLNLMGLEEMYMSAICSRCHNSRWLSSIDTAKVYGNEEAVVKKAIKQSGIDTETAFVTSKLWGWWDAGSRKRQKVWRNTK